MTKVGYILHLVQQLQTLLDQWHKEDWYTATVLAHDIQTLISELQPQSKFKRGELLHSKATGRIGICVASYEESSILTSNTLEMQITMSSYQFREKNIDLEYYDPKA